MRSLFALGTWFDAEELAYPEGSLRQTRRRFSARCADGKVRRGFCGIPDTAFTIPARLTVRRRTVSGYVSLDDGVLVFNAAGKNAPLLGGE